MRGAGVLIAALTVGPPTSSGPHAVTFVIDMRAEIGAGRFHADRDEVGVRGGVAPLSWDETLPAADRDGDGRYEVTAAFPRAPFGGQGVTYKFKVERATKPFVDRTYRTRRDPATTAVAGASFGALISLWLALEHPDVFGNVLAVSPALRWNEDAVMKKIAASAVLPPIWVDIGTREGENAVAEARRLRDALLRQGCRLGENLEYVEQPDGQHDEILLAFAGRADAPVPVRAERAAWLIP